MLKNLFSIVPVFMVAVVAIIGCQQEKGEAGLQADSVLRSLPDVASDFSLADLMRSQIEALPEQGVQDRMERAQSAVKTLEYSVPLRALFAKEVETWLDRMVVMWLYHHRFDYPTPLIYSDAVVGYSNLLEKLISGEASLEESTNAVCLLRVVRWYVADKRGQARFDDLFDAANTLEARLVIYMVRKSL